MRSEREIPGAAAEQRTRITSAAFFVYGAWLVASPYVLDFSWHPQAWWNALLVGVCLVILGLLRSLAPLRFAPLRWTAFVLGGWLLVSPFLAGYTEIMAAFFNAVVLGVLILGAAVVPVGEPEPRPA